MFTSFDAVVLVLVSAAVYQGYRIGIISGAIFTVAGALAAFVFGKIFPSAALVLTLLFLLFLAAFMMFSRWYKNEAGSKKTPRYYIDRALGGFAGALIVLILTGTIVFPFMHQMPGPKKEGVFNSFSARYVIPAVQRFLPETQASIIGKVHGVIVALQRGAAPEAPKKKPSSKNK